MNSSDTLTGKYFSPMGGKEQGAVLFLTMTILLILTVLGISSIQTTSMQERMARNYRDVNVAFQGAEAAVIEAEEYIETIANIGAFPDESDANLCVAGLCNAIDGNEKWTQNFGYVDWTDNTTHIETDVTAAELGAADVPRYMIEYVSRIVIEQDTLNIGNVGEGGNSGRAYIFRITGRGTGGTNEAKAMVQALYGRQF